ncbi:MAG: hypothetical protein B7Z37_17990 [Verrucomicrobia bacterium 12-59-8]|nr:MAG: hypothetical protein B7Z37_17990 [Verrucomicrobia bacterium 12-59-8]
MWRFIRRVKCLTIKNCVRSKAFGGAVDMRKSLASDCSFCVTQLGRVGAYRMSVKSLFKHAMAFGAALMLPLSYTQQTDHNSGARRDRWEWAGLAMGPWESKENAEFRWVRDVLNLPPDYFVQATGPSILACSIGALPGKFRETKVFMNLWENATAEEKPLVCIEAVLCLVESDWRERERMMDEAGKRWCRA